jgi:hypothetical protein
MIMKIMHSYITVGEDERAAFLEKNSAPVNEAEGFIWLAFQECNSGIVELFCDELNLAADMARRSGLDELAMRLENGESDVVP